MPLKWLFVTFSPLHYRFAEIGEIWAKYNALGLYNIRIYQEYIEPKYGIGLSTFYKVLNIPVKKLLAQMDDKNVIRTDENYNVLK